MLDHIANTAEGKVHEPSITWLQDGTSFLIVDVRLFTERTLPVYFNSIKYKSFMRQLHMYGFQRFTAGRRESQEVPNATSNKGVYFHPAFIRGNPSLCKEMKRYKIKGTGRPRKNVPSKGAARTTMIQW
jgi:hypothetical protein